MTAKEIAGKQKNAKAVISKIHFLIAFPPFP
jgi:hypothetical protein